MAICLHIIWLLAAPWKWWVDVGNGVQKWQGLDPMIGIRATGIYTTLRNAGMEPQSIGGARVGWLALGRPGAGCYIWRPEAGSLLQETGITRQCLTLLTVRLPFEHPTSSVASTYQHQCIHLLIRANAMLDRTSALDHYLCFFCTDVHELLIFVKRFQCRNTKLKAGY